MRFQSQSVRALRVVEGGSHFLRRDCAHPSAELLAGFIPLLFLGNLIDALTRGLKPESINSQADPARPCAKQRRGTTEQRPQELGKNEIMKILLRTILYLSLVVWLGAEIFFHVVAAIAVSTLRPDTHAAGTLVCALLHILHTMGLVAGPVALIALVLAPFLRIYKPSMVWAPMASLALMIVLTGYSQFGIIPAMGRDRIAADGTEDSPGTTNPSWADFNRLHQRAEYVEEAILVLGLATVALGSAAETAKAQGPGDGCQFEPVASHPATLPSRQAASGSC